MKKLKIALVQTKLFWEDAAANREHIGSLLKGIKKGAADLVLLPEMFSTGFTMNAKEISETMQGETVQWMKELARAKQAVICGSLVISERGNYYNRLLWVTPQGTITTYDKRHLFRMAKEEKTYTAGTKRIIVELNGWKICPLICYDLRFPVWCRNNNEYDLLLFVANWPSRRKFAWKQLLVARAIENQCFLAGLNRVGKDGKGIPYSGESIVHDPAGETVLKIKPGTEGVFITTLDPKILADYRKNFPVMMDRDRFVLKN
jgi:omega-amidase